MPDPPGSPTPLPRGVERRSVVALLVSTLCSSTAVTLVTTVLGKLVFDLTGSELSLGLLGLAEFAPAALLVFVTGSVADRLDRRRVAFVALLLEAATIAGMALYAASDPTSAGPLFAMVFAFGVFRAFAAPATRSLPADTVRSERLPWLVARQSITWQTSAIVGPVLGGFLYVVGVGIPFAVGAALVVLGACVILLVQPRPVAPRADRPRPGLKDAMEGLRFVRSEPILFGAITLDLFAVLFGGAVALLPAIAEDRLGVGAVGLGWLRAAIGIGAASVTLVPLVTPHDKRGRVLAVEMVFIGASNELGAFESGVVGQLLGPAAAIVLGGVGTLAVSGLWFRIFPALARVDEFPAAVEAADPDEIAAAVHEQEAVDRATMERDSG